MPSKLLNPPLDRTTIDISANLLAQYFTEAREARVVARRQRALHVGGCLGASAAIFAMAWFAWGAFTEAESAQAGLARATSELSQVQEKGSLPPEVLALPSQYRQTNRHLLKLLGTTLNAFPLDTRLTTLRVELTPDRQMKLTVGATTPALPSIRTAIDRVVSAIPGTEGVITGVAQLPDSNPIRFKADVEIRPTLPATAPSSSEDSKP